MELTVNGVRIFYQMRGSGSPVLLVHGNGESHEIFAETADLLAKDHLVITPDSRCHGNSQDTQEISYDRMAEDMMGLIRQLELKHPVFYGFSDGGIVGLLIAMREPELLGRLIVSGANLNPMGLHWTTRVGIRLQDLFSRSKLTRLMLREPDIRPQDLGKIRVPTAVLAGQWDVVKRKHTLQIAEHIPGALLRIIPGEGHGSYIIHSTTLYEILKDYL